MFSGRIISGILAFVMLNAPWSAGVADTAEAKREIKQITVRQSGEYDSIEKARDYIRTLDKTKFSGIEVTLEAGEYVISEPITFVKEDTGTPDCPITYKGEDGALIVGGITLSADDFSESAGGLTEYFPKEVGDRIVSVDLKQYGFTTEMITDAMKSNWYHTLAPFLSVNGVRQTLAQYPNDWLHVTHTVTNSSDGTTDTAIDGVTTQTVQYGEEHMTAVQSWSQIMPIFVRARLMKLWCPDDSRVVKIYDDTDKVDILFAGGHEPADGTILYFYNVPEALDVPGEYIIDEDAVLYYYPTDEFDGGVMTVPLSDGLIELEDADYITFENIGFSSSAGDGLTLTGNHISVKDCTVSSICKVGMKFVGEGNLCENCVISDIGDEGISVINGDLAAAQGEETLITENDVSACSVTSAYGYAITATGVNITVSHNDVHDTNYKAIHIVDCVNGVVEYNHVWNVLLLSDDVGAMAGNGRYNANVVFRYNYVHDIGPVGEADRIKEYNPDYNYLGAFAFYLDDGCSYMEVHDNVVCGCDTGYLSNGGRGNSCHNNVFIDCHDWYIWFSEVIYSRSVTPDGTLIANMTFDDFVHSDVWKELNPDLDLLKSSADGTDVNDPALFAAPVGNECYDNFIMFNKAERNFSNWGIRPFNIEDKVVEFSGDGIVTDEEKMKTYSSKREKFTLEEIFTEYAKDCIGIDYETFLTIGRTKK